MRKTLRHQARFFAKAANREAVIEQEDHGLPPSRSQAGQLRCSPPAEGPSGRPDAPQKRPPPFDQPQAPLAQQLAWLGAPGSRNGEGRETAIHVRGESIEFIPEPTLRQCTTLFFASNHAPKAPSPALCSTRPRLTSASSSAAPPCRRFAARRAATAASGARGADASAGPATGAAAGAAGAAGAGAAGGGSRVGAGGVARLRVVKPPPGMRRETFTIEPL